ncbi:MAG TPA: M13 family metallopeptidase [Vicinamibacterales bacterium]|nr:M13 family metallopeptidase [Vicinamibacterales bacterium]
MIRRAFLASLVAAALAQPATYAQNGAAPGSTASGAPVYGRFGVDTAGMDPSVDPGDDFAAYANGTWQKTTAIPADRSNWGTSTILTDQAEQRVRGLVEDAAGSQQASKGSAAQKVGDFYTAFMDEAAIDKAGRSPLQPYLAAVASIGNKGQLSRAIGFADRNGVNVPIRTSVTSDLKNNDRYALYVEQDGLGLPDRDYYLDEKNERFADVRAKYVQHVAAMLTLAGLTDTATKAQAIVALERKIAEAHWTRVESRQMDKIYNPVTRAELATKFPGLDWNAYITGAQLPDKVSIIAVQPSALAGIAQLVANEPLDVWKDYLVFHIVSDYASVLPKAFVDEDFAFNGKVLAGTPEPRERWRRGVDQVNEALGEAVGQLYVAKYFPPAAKAKADELVHNLLAAMDVRLQNLTWMAPETKVKARAKLAAFTPKIGYPDKFRDYSKLDVKRNDAFGNLRRAREFEYERELTKSTGPVDRGEWEMTPQTVNAYANPSMNEIVFPAAILQAPYFDPNADPAVNYGGIGAVIGHELSHHFDDQGRKFDAKGALADWWTPTDVERFKAYTDRVVQQYSEYEPLPGKHVNGELTLGENMADLAGVMVAYDAYRISLHGQEAPVIDGFTGDQRFFLGWAQVWRRKYRDEALLRQITTDPHTASHFRPYVVRNIDAWYAAFNVQPGRKLYLAPADRVRVW